jgi:predicted GNAT superfamily acetyltransferase
MHDSLNRGLSSDRLVVEWPLDDAEVSTRAAGGYAASNPQPVICLNGWTFNDMGYPLNRGVDLTQTEARGPLYIAIPAQFREMKRDDIQLAFDWRFHTRTLFLHYLSAGWIVSASVSGKKTDSRLHYYVLLKKEHVEKN